MGQRRTRRYVWGYGAGERAMCVWGGRTVRKDLKTPGGGIEGRQEGGRERGTGVRPGELVGVRDPPEGGGGRVRRRLGIAAGAGARVGTGARLRERGESDGARRGCLGKEGVRVGLKKTPQDRP